MGCQGNHRPVTGNARWGRPQGEKRGWPRGEPVSIQLCLSSSAKSFGARSLLTVSSRRRSPSARPSLASGSGPTSGRDASLSPVINASKKCFSRVAGAELPRGTGQSPVVGRQPHPSLWFSTSVSRLGGRHQFPTLFLQLLFQHLHVQVSGRFHPVLVNLYRQGAD